MTKGEATHFLSHQRGTGLQQIEGAEDETLALRAQVRKKKLLGLAAGSGGLRVEALGHD